MDKVATLKHLLSVPQSAALFKDLSMRSLWKIWHVTRENNLKSIAKLLGLLEKAAFSSATIKPEIKMNENLAKYVVLWSLSKVFLMSFALYVRVSSFLSIFSKLRKSPILIKERKPKWLYLCKINYKGKHGQTTCKILHVKMMLSLENSLKVPSCETIISFALVHLYRAVLLMRHRPMTPFLYHFHPQIR